MNPRIDDKAPRKHGRIIVPGEENVNNALSVPITITSPDLAVGSVQGVVVDNGRSAWVTYTVNNQGSGPAKGAWKDSVFFAPTNAGGPEDLFTLKKIGQRSRELMPGQSYTVTVKLKLPSARKLAAGDYQFGVFTDSSFQIAELDETGNNAGESETVRL